jgi:outer membrane receptor protein involved in Fe transport
MVKTLLYHYNFYPTGTVFNTMNYCLKLACLRISFFLMFALGCAESYAQTTRDLFIEAPDNGKPVSQVLAELEKKHAIDLIYDEKKMLALTITRVTLKQRITDYFNAYLPAYRIIRVTDKIFFVVDKQQADFHGWTKENYVVLKEKSGSKISLDGTVLDGKTDEPLAGAQVYFADFKKGTLSDVNGNFTVDGLPNAMQLMDVQFVGYDVKRYVIAFSPYAEHQRISTTLLPESRELQSVTITAERINENVLNQITGIEKLSIATIKSVPTFLGEVDPIRSLTTLPGVSVSELSSGFIVRGGESGQNLILQDGGKIYNPSHLFGFFSAFNPDMVSGVTLYKGGGPANFGGRISSILDVTLKNGDAGKTKVAGGVGLVSSRLAIEGPIVKNRSSYMLGGRISYCNWLIKSTDDIQLRNSSANFRDITAKIFHTFNDNNFITISAYNSYDGFSLATDSTFSWGTFNTVLKWDHTFTDRISSTLNLSNSNYFSEVESFSEIESFVYKNEIKNYDVKYDLNFSIGDESKVVAGLELDGTTIEPGKLVPADDSENIAFQDMNDQQMVEGAIYLQSDLKFSEKWSLSAGLRYSHFLRIGEDNIYVFDYGNMQGRYPSISDTIRYASGDIIKEYNGFEPRVSIRYLLNPDISLKASYYRGYQYMHLISNTTSTTPQDYWTASGPYLKPQMGDQYSLGYFQNLSNNRYEFSVEGFYKDIYNAVDYIEGADITLNPALEVGLSQGKGVAYGVELFVKKNTGRFNGWLSYTYSRSLRKFDEQTTGNITINEGKYYPSAFDQPHIFNVVLNYKVGQRSFLSANFNYSTGRPITIPVSKFSYDVYLSVLNYSQRNEYRIPDYHRLDVSFTVKQKPGKNRRFKGEWVFSIFNLYGRKNTYAITFNRYGTANKLSVLGSIFPSVTYNFSF